MKIGLFEKIAFYVLLTSGSIIAAIKLHSVANLTRPVSGWGGELMILLIPIIAYFTIANIKLQLSCRKYDNDR